ncbi:MAG: gliding motility-associated C-terminal domain-containing protein [Flavobacteriales bacterium]
MKKLITIIFFSLSLNVVFGQISITLDFYEDNFIPGTNTFKCSGLYTYLSINVFPADTPYSVTLLKDNQIFDQAIYSSDIFQIPSVFTLDSLLYAGNYQLTVVTSNNETIQESFILFDPIPLSFDVNTTSPESCEPSGEIIITNISGGIAPYSLGIINSQGVFDPIYSQNQTASSFTIEDLESGFYTVSLQDINGCIFTQGNDVPIEIAQGADPLNIFSVSQDDSVEVCVQGGVAPFSFILQSDTIITNDSCVSYALCPDEYSLIVFDAVQSTQCADTVDFIIEDLDGYIEQETSTMIVQSGGVRPFSYSWELNGDLQDGQTDSVYTPGLCPGEYRCRILDAIGCLFSFNITVEEFNSSIEDEVDCFDNDFKSIVAEISGGTEPYQYLWNTGETSNSIENLSPQKYTLSVTDNNGCEFYDELTLPVIYDSCLFNAFSPNGDQINDTWAINSSFLFENTEVLIYNRWGAKVFQSLGYKKQWDGRNEAGNIVSEGVYFYTILLNNGYQKIKGSVTVFY